MVKQVICIRKDLNMRKGKMVAQGAHAAMAFLIEELMANDGKLSLDDFSKPQQAWISGNFTKVCLQIESKDELLSIFHAAYDAGFEVHIITDMGATEFHGVPTMTCLAIGPDESEKIDAITGHLKLF